MHATTRSHQEGTGKSLLLFGCNAPNSVLLCSTLLSCSPELLAYSGLLDPLRSCKWQGTGPRRPRLMVPTFNMMSRRSLGRSASHHDALQLLGHCICQKSTSALDSKASVSQLYSGTVQEKAARRKRGLLAATVASNERSRNNGWMSRGRNWALL